MRLLTCIAFAYTVWCRLTVPVTREKRDVTRGLPTLIQGW